MDAYGQPSPSRHSRCNTTHHPCGTPPRTHSDMPCLSTAFSSLARDARRLPAWRGRTDHGQLCRLNHVHPATLLLHGAALNLCAAGRRARGWLSPAHCAGCFAFDLSSRRASCTPTSKLILWNPYSGTFQGPRSRVWGKPLPSSLPLLPSAPASAPPPYHLAPPAILVHRPRHAWGSEAVLPFCFDPSPPP